MAEKKVLVYYMHEDEEAECHRWMKDATWSPGYAMGTMAEEDIDKLERAGMVVEVLDDAEADAEAEPPAFRGGLESTGPAGAPRAPGRSPLAGPPRDAVLHPSKDNVFAIEFDGPFLMPAWREELAGIGVELRERLPDGRYTAYLSLGQVGAVEALPFVRDVTLFAPEDTSSAVFTEPAATRRRGGLEGLGGDEPETVAFDVLLHRPEDRDDVVQWLEDNGVEIVARGSRKLRVKLAVDSPRVREIEVLPEVRQIAEYVEPKLANQMARRLLGIDPNPSPGPALPQTGAGEIVAVADSGLDDSHPDFAGRIVELVDRGRPGDTSDPHGHGTHVAGSVLADGAASGGDHRGAAPGAKLFFQSIMDHDERLTGLPVELGELFEEAHRAGARIHNNSWSADTKSFYTFNALEVDEYVEQHPDMLITIAAGNEASAADPVMSQVGFVDWQSIGSPATAKNALTVGASRNERTEGGFSTRTYRQFDRDRFPDPPIAEETISGDPEGLAAFSARGPCDPRRIKPDVVAPGTDILSTRASTAPESSFWGLLPGDDRYGYMGGTSMATPLVSGCAALVREYYREERQHEASAALLKATLINSTRRLNGIDAIADHDQLPNFHQGFGAVHMPWAVPNPRQPWMKLEFLDTWKSGQRFEPGGLGRLRIAFQVEGGEFLRLCLAWTDPAAGASLQNVLGVMLEHQGLVPPKRLGNEDRPSPIGRLDRDNNVQIVRIEDPPAGNYLVQIFAANLLAGQDWALVVTGDLAGGLTTI